MKFNWENFKNGKIGVNCRTKEEAEKFIDMCYNNGICWYTEDDNERTYWLRYKKNTYYSCMNGKLVYGNDTNYIEIYKFKDVTNDNKVELKEGMIVECRNKNKYVLRRVSDVLIGSNFDGWIKAIYNENLCENCYHDEAFDIMKIYISMSRNLENLFDKKYLTCIWERKESKKMTLAQISEALGYEVEVVDNE